MLITRDQDGTVNLHSPTAMPKASTFLWNKQMMVHVNCRGYVVSQFMQPEPAKYSRGPSLEARTFMQPEQPYYAHHPGRFFYIKDEDSGEVFSLPYEPVRAPLDAFTFRCGKYSLEWHIRHSGLEATLRLQIPVELPVELWSISIKNNGTRLRNLSVYAYFSVGYMSWMNQAAEYDARLGGIVCSSVTPYQQYQDYFKIKEYKDLTFLLSDKKPTSFETQSEHFEGEGGLHAPDAVMRGKTLSCNDARYETPVAVLHFKEPLKPGQASDTRFVFGPAKSKQEIQQLKKQFMSAEAFARTARDYQCYIDQGAGCLNVSTPDEPFDHFVNHWLARQMYYHGDVNRLTTDPQTRNYLQDSMGMVYIKPDLAKAAFLRALSQQKYDGAMPEGILLNEQAELKYINQVPHKDHAVWLPVCLQAYLDETQNYDLLDERVPYADCDIEESVFEHISKAMRRLLSDRDERGLSFIAQGDWCDPMNMVGCRGRGVSAWLTLAAAYALKLWSVIARDYAGEQAEAEFSMAAENCNEAANNYCWDGDWYARGITDNNVVFGVATDSEGKMYLNPQSWSMLSGAADSEKKAKMIQAIDEHLLTPYGVAMLAPAYTAMREDIGRVTQKFPGSAENGSIYNHAVTFYIYALYQLGECDRAYALLKMMLPGPAEDDFLQRGQLPVFIPNYYRGAYHQFPDRAGRSSQLFNTGTVHWYYRCLIEGLFGVKGTRGGLCFNPQLPSHWDHCTFTRRYAGAEFTVTCKRSSASRKKVFIDGHDLQADVFNNIHVGKTYSVLIELPRAKS